MIRPAQTIRSPAISSSQEWGDRTLRNLLVAACLGLSRVWYIELAHGRMAEWDQVIYPLIVSVLAFGAVALTWLPKLANAVRICMVLSANAVVLFEFRMEIWSGGAIDQYQLFATLYWMPLCISTGFVFLSLRPAIIISLIFLILESGIVALKLISPQGLNGPDYLPLLFENVAIAQMVYVIMLAAVLNLRSHYQSANEHAQMMQRVATTDALTELPNRRWVDQSLAAWLNALPFSVENSIMVIDVDHFKAINDNHGHGVGDSVLVAIAEILTSQMRSGDVVVRWGGDEFIALAPGTNNLLAIELAERMRLAVGAYEFPHGQPVTLSIGLANFRASDDIRTTLQRADAALFSAKQSGRSRVIAI